MRYIVFLKRLSVIAASLQQIAAAYRAIGGTDRNATDNVAGA